MADFNSLEELRDAVIAPVVEEAPKREPIRDSLGRAYATGKRKDAVARVWIKPGKGKVTVNGKEMNVYFARPVLQMLIGQSFGVAGVVGEFDVMATVKGGGLSGQAYIDITAYLLQMNNFPEGSAELTPEPAALAAVVIQQSKP